VDAIVAGHGHAVAAHTPAAPFRTPWGEPDRNGVWDYRTITPLRRSPELAGQPFFAEEEARVRAAQHGPALQRLTPVFHSGSAKTKSALPPSGW
jgi:hypothetical protein